MKLAVIGTGYIGLVTGVCLAKLGHDVVCVDKDAAKIKSLSQGHVPIFEPGLAEMLAETMQAGRLSFTTDTQAAVRASDAVFVAVGTPTAADGQSSDLTFVFDVARDIARALNGFKVIIMKSTVPVGTGEKFANAMSAVAPDADFEVASNPEFLREGVAISDFMTPDRIVIGANAAGARDVLNTIYAPFAAQQFPFLHVSRESAELIKFASNGFLAAKIAFINEIAEVCEKTGANVHDVARGMGLDDRIGPKFLQTGPGYGGSCFPKDTRALAAMARAVGSQLRITEAVVASNDATILRMVDKITALAGGQLKGKTIAVFGVTFKPDTDDMREAPSLVILPALQKAGASLRVVDPEGRKHGEGLLPGIAWFADAYGAAEGADMVVVLTEWRVFRSLELSKLAGVMKTPFLADLRNIYLNDKLKDAGFVFCQIGT
jgi:UDPglucose 6-dehydrogenase